MKRILVLSIATASTVFLGGSARAITVATDPVGFANISLPANSESYISVPFTRPADFVGAIQSVSANTMTLSGSPNLAANKYVYVAGSQPNHYYALIGNGGSSNPKEGHTFLITGNAGNTVTVDTSLEDLSGITANTQVTIIPYWTLGTVFPASDVNVSFTGTTSTPTYKTEVSIPNDSANGINLPYLATYYFSSNANGSGTSGWRIEGDNNTDRSDDILLPDSYFVVKNQNGAPTLPLTTLGAVLTKKLAVPLRTWSGGPQDNPAAIVRPLDVNLNMTGLNPADGSFTAGNGTTTGDQLLVFSNSQVGFGKAPSVYYRDSSTMTWRLQGDLNQLDHGNDVIPLGTGFIVRKATAPTGNVFWTNSFPVQAVSAVSRKTHGSAGTFDLPLNLTGTPTIEPRAAIGNSHTVVVTFPTTVTFGNASITSGTGPAVSNTTGSGTNQATVTVSTPALTSQQYITVTIPNVNDGTNTNDVSIVMGLLIGDGTGDGFVNTGDATATRNRSGHSASEGNNFRFDYNCDGNVDSADATIMRARSGNTVFPN